MRHPLLPPGLGAVLGVSLWPWAAPQPTPCLLGALACVALTALAPTRRAAALTSLVFGLLLGLAAPGLAPEGPALSGLVSVEGRVRSVSGKRALLALHRVGDQPAQGDVLAWFPEAAPMPGVTVAAFTRAQRLWDDALPGEPDPLRSARLRHVRSELRVLQFTALTATVEGVDPFAQSKNRALLRALAFGERAELPDATRDLLRRTGTSHLLAISGLHLGLAAAMAAGLASALLRPLTLIWPYGGLRGPPALIGGLAALAFGQLVGWPVSARRAATMILAALLLTATDRPPKAWNLLGLAAGAVALADPGAVRELSFGLSFGAVVGLLCVSPRIERLVPLDVPRPLRWLARGLGATLGATAGTLPYGAWVFQELSWTSPLANLLAVPWVSGVVLPATLLGASGFQLAGAVADRGLDLLLAWLSLVDAPTLHPAVGPVGAALLLLAVLQARRVGLAAGLVTLALFLRPMPAELHLTMLSVGQGDALLIEWPSGERALIDGGPPSDRVLRWLRRRGVRHLDEVVLTHPHPDHSGGLSAVLEGIEVDALRVPRMPLSSEADFIALVELAAKRGARILGPFDPSLPGVEVLHPSAEALAEGGSVNDLSLVLRLTYGEHTALFTGDVEAPAEARLLSVLEPVDLLKVAHHGSRSSSTEAFLEATQPRIALIPCGVGNRFGHPHAEVLRRLRGARVLRADLHGSVQLRSDGHRWRVRTWRPGARWSRWTDAAAPPSPPPRAARSSG